MPEDSHQIDSSERRSLWENHIEQWRISGLSQAAYCRRHRLKVHRFYYWRRRLSAPQDGVSFLPVALSSLCDIANYGTKSDLNGVTLFRVYG